MEKYKRITDKRLTSILTSKEMGCFYAPKSKEERAELVELSEQLTYEAIYTRLAELEDKIENGTLIDTTNVCYEKEADRDRYIIYELVPIKTIIDFADTRAEVEKKIKELKREV